MKNLLPEKTFLVTYKSKYHPFEGKYVKWVKSSSPKQIKEDWPSIILSDEYKIVKIEGEVK